MTRFLVILASLVLFLSGAEAQSVKSPRDLVQASLVADVTAIEPAKPFTLGLRLRMKPNWHVYWRNPGDSGLPPEVAWTLPDGFSAGEIAWPAPHRIPVQSLMNYGYAGEVVLLVPVTPGLDLSPSKPARIEGKLTYLVCEEICIPGSADLRLDVPVAQPGTEAELDSANAALFTRARAALPVEPPWPVRLSATPEGRLVLGAEAPGLKADTIRDAAFFPYSESAIENAAPQDLAVDESGFRLTLTRADDKAPPRSELAGILTFDEQVDGSPVRRAYAIGTAPPLAGTQPAAAEAPIQSTLPAASADDALTIWSAAGLALLGGVLLNLMPCVFPVLSIKVLSLVKQAGDTPSRVRLHGLAYTAGVLASFLALAGLLIALKAGGAGIGWGFQLQSPIMVAGLAYLLFAMGLSLSGVVHVGAGIAGLGDGLTRRAGLQGSFFTGVLATVVATPCTAPFMGAAVGFALTQAPLVGLTVFGSLGLGLALPFLALTLWPGALRAMPRPGAWMETLKGVLAFPVYLTVAWLIWVLSQQVGSEGLLVALVGLVLVGFSAWAWARASSAGALGQPLARAVALAALLAAAGFVMLAARDHAADQTKALAQGTEPFTQTRLDALRAQGRNVFVDMTAAWCITCQVNERGTLASGEIRDAFKARDIVTLRGDWTNQNPEITRLLERHGRSGVPLYLLYQGNAEPAVLPQILTRANVLAEVEKLKAPEPLRTEAIASPTAH